MTHLCVPIFVTDLAGAKRDIAAAAEAGADLVELRIDEFTDPALVRSLVAESILPAIVTCRPEWEGGHADVSDAQRLEALNAALDSASGQARYIDVELETLRRQPDLAPATPNLIVSSHHFAGRPARMNNLVLELNASPSAINKIVWTAKTIRDNLEAFDLIQHRHKPTIALCMGEAGLISRLLAKKFGAFLTFASLHADAGTAAGQIPIGEMKGLYRWDAIGPATKIYGVVASPVGHSMSPAIHNAAFDATGYDGLYLPLLVEPGYESFKAFMETFLHLPGLDLSGLSVTLPHKENALRYLREMGADVEDLAGRIGAVNTIVVERHSAKDNAAAAGAGPALSLLPPSPSSPPHALRGINTDYAAILDSITSALRIERQDLKQYRVAVLGAGGTGRTAVAALAHYGASVTIYNRSLERAAALAAEFNGRSGPVSAAPLSDISQATAEIYLNTTSLGMHPNIDASPVGEAASLFSPQSLVFDTIYNPPRTRLLQQAESAGARTIGGIEMFVRQAVAQFEAWTGLPAPRDVMRGVIEARLAR
jgi:3-dehydroquinate dehydratase/shikimate dehydrogenase